MSTYLIANFDRKEYLRPEMFGEYPTLNGVVDSYQGVLTGLTILLADGNNRGGGDLRSDAEIIGSWIGNRIAIIDDHVTAAELSEPGMEDIPLQRQLLSMGKDVSQDIIDAITAAEDDWAVASLNPKHVLPLPAQRELSERGAQLLLNVAGRKSRLENLEDIFAILGVGGALTPFMTCKRLQGGLDKMAVAFGRPERWTVTRCSFAHGTKPVKASEYSNELRPGHGIVKLTIVGYEAANPEEEKQFEVRFDLHGASVETIYNWFFPDCVFERQLSLADTVKSKEVAKLLTLIQDQMEA